MKNEEIFEADLLIICAHPDDAELSAGGTIAKVSMEGKITVVADLTAGELGTRGSREIRLQEAQRSAEILGLRERINLGMTDGNILVNEENTLKVITVIRKYKPKIVIMNPPFERHPDHESAHRLIRTAMFKSGLLKVQTESKGEIQEPWRIRKMFYFMQSYTFDRHPDFFVDISDTFDIKMQAIKEFTSQVWVPGKSNPKGPVTRLSRPEFLEELKARAIYFGTLTGFRYAEAFCSVEPLGIKSLSVFL